MRLNRAWRRPNDEDAEIVEKVWPALTLTAPESVDSMLKAVRYILRNEISGDIVECGVYKGGSMMAVAMLLKRLSVSDRRIWLYDTYSGMSESNPEYDWNYGTGDVVRGAVWEQMVKNTFAALDEVKANMGSTGYEGPIRYVVGKVEDTIPGEIPERIALLRLDTDFYESTKHELEQLYPRLVPSGVLIIDDYNALYGARKATDDYFRTRKMLLTRFASHGAVIGVKP